LLESLVRIAQAHARLMFREVVMAQDAIMAITIIDSSAQAASPLGDGSSKYITDCDNPDALYERHKKELLAGLYLGDMEEAQHDYSCLRVEDIISRGVNAEKPRIVEENQENYFLGFTQPQSKNVVEPLVPLSLSQVLSHKTEPGIDSQPLRRLDPEPQRYELHNRSQGNSQLIAMTASLHHTDKFRRSSMSDDDTDALDLNSEDELPSANKRQKC
jgi:hypothetical protein